MLQSFFEINVMLSKRIEKRCASGISFRPCFSLFQVRIYRRTALDARAYRILSRRICRYAYACQCIHLHMRPPTHEILTSSACVVCMHTCMHTRTYARMHARMYERVSRQGRNFTPVGETASHERENYCTTCDLSLIINTPTPGIFKPDTHSRLVWRQRGISTKLHI